MLIYLTGEDLYFNHEAISNRTPSGIYLLLSMNTQSSSQIISKDKQSLKHSPLSLS